MSLGCLLYGPPGTGKTLLARAVASQLDANFLKVVSSAIVDKYIGESARLIREMFNYAKDHQPCIIFMDEIDAIGGRRFSEGTSADREIQRTLMELLNQMDGFDSLGQVKMIMATNRPDTLDPALLRPGRLDRKIEIPLPNEQARLEILKIHAGPIAKHGEIDYEAIVKLSDTFNGADLRFVKCLKKESSFIFIFLLQERLYGSWFICDTRRKGIRDSGRFYESRA